MVMIAYVKVGPRHYGVELYDKTKGVFNNTLNGSYTILPTANHEMDPDVKEAIIKTIEEHWHQLHIVYQNMRAHMVKNASCRPSEVVWCKKN